MKAILIAAVAALCMAGTAVASIDPGESPQGESGHWNGVRCTVVLYRGANQTYIVKHPGPWHTEHVYGVTPSHPVNPIGYGFKWVLTDAKCFPAAPAAVVAPSSSFMCRILDANEPAQAILDSEILSGDPAQRSLAGGWLPAAYDHGKFVCEPVANPTSWTDDSLSVYDAPNTAYANPIAG